MRIIAKKRIEEFARQHANCANALRLWYRVASGAQWTSIIEVRKTYRSADDVGNKTVFNIKGNAYRLITSIHYDKGRISIRELLTHAEYTKGEWKSR